MPVNEHDQLTFLGDKHLLVISSLGLACVISVVLYFVQRAGWHRHGAAADEGHEDGDAALLGPRTRVVHGGREATKAARKEAKKQARAEFKRSQNPSVNQERIDRLKAQKRRREQKRLSDEADATECRDRFLDVQRRLEERIIQHKVIVQEDMQDELGCTSSDVRKALEDLERTQNYAGITVDDARGRSCFVRLSDDDFRNIASRVERRGRIRIHEFVAEVNQALKPACSSPVAENEGEDASRNFSLSGSETSDLQHGDGFLPEKLP